jgi:bifunctional DNA-binding transcriptional regulator/antitoxin component of YhaV-PrlF toxin-antitoxin module
MHGMTARIAPDGSLAIPAPFLRAAGLQPGDELVMILDRRGGLRLLTPMQAIRRAQELVARYLPKGRSLSRELLAERRRGV